ncbi:MAG: prephenate dehydratase [Pseudomonadota bacterium]
MSDQNDLLPQANGRIAFQGEIGAFSHQACAEVFPAMEPMPCATFEDAIAATRGGTANLAMLPIENSIHGRVADIHQLLPGSGLYIVAEHFVPIRLQLLAHPGLKLEEVAEAQSHPVALAQCRQFLRAHGIRAVTGVDTAGSAKFVAEAPSGHRAAIASRLAAAEYGLDVVAADIEDADHNTTRFLVMSRQRIEADPAAEAVVTSFVFEVRNVPAALYKAMGGFATNGVNMTKLESYMVNGSFTATEFYAEVDGHPEQPALRRALDELKFFTNELRILGVYQAHPYRKHAAGGSAV